jgi:penicillin-binding protein 1C
MLHLNEVRDPPPFPAPVGYLLEPICATTGHRPTAACPAVVREWVAPRDLARWRSPAPPLGSAYDAWLATQPRLHDGTFQIAFPHDGDTFALNPTDDPLAKAEQRLELRAIGMRSAVNWSVNGIPIRLDSSGTALWSLRLGTWTFTARDGPRRQSVTIRVVRPPQALRPGFTVR